MPNTGNDFEPDGFDETGCLYDGELIDDELYAALANFAAGVRIFVLSDSCHSVCASIEPRMSMTKRRVIVRDLTCRSL